VCNNVKTDTVLCYEEVSENASRAQGLRHLQRVEALNSEAFLSSLRVQICKLLPRTSEQRMVKVLENVPLGTHLLLLVLYDVCLFIMYAVLCKYPGRTSCMCQKGCKNNS
jgi:hypothetical protein